MGLLQIIASMAMAIGLISSVFVIMNLYERKEGIASKCILIGSSQLLMGLLFFIMILGKLPPASTPAILTRAESLMFIVSGVFAIFGLFFIIAGVIIKLNQIFQLRSTPAIQTSK